MSKGPTRMRYFINLRTSILCIVLLAVIPAIILISIDGLEDRARVLSEIHQSASYRSEQASQQLEQLAEGLRNILVVLSREPSITDFEIPAANSHLKDLLEHLPHVFNLGVTDASGIVVASGIPFAEPVDLSERLYLKKALQENTFVCGVYQVGKITGIETVNFAYPLHDDGHAPRGVVYAAVDLRYFQKVLGGVSVTPGGDVTVLDADGRILYSRQPTIHRAGEVFRAEKAHFDFTSDPAPVSVTCLDNVQRIYADRAVSGVEGLHVLVGLPVEQALIAARIALTRKLILLGAGAGLAMGLAWLLGNLFIVRRVNAMVRAFDDMGAGNLDVRSGMVHDRDELGRLAGSFDSMALALQKRDNELRESQKKFEALFHSSPVPLVLSNSEDNRLLDVNRVFCQLFGFAREEVIGKTALELSLLDRAGQHECLDLLKTRGRVWAYPATIRTKSGNVLSALWSADLIKIDGRACILSSAVDVTELREIGQRLQHEIHFNQLLLNTSPALIVAIGIDGKTMMMNRAMLELLEYGAEEMVGMDYLNVFVPEEERDNVKTIFACLAHNNATTVNTNTIRSKSGNRYLVEWHGQSVQSQEGGNDFYVGVGIDITERRAAEQEREKIQLQLIQAQKMESVGRLAGGVAHDFNNMLGVILGHVELALRYVAADQVFHSDLIEIRKAAERSADLTSQLLAFARKQTINPRVIDLNRTVESMLKMLQRLIGEDIDLAWLPGKNLWPVKLDPGQIDQILANLFVNARDAIVGAGKVTIETGTAVLDEAFCKDHAGFVPGEYVLLTVSDNGCGIERQTLTHIFEPFFTTKDLDKGTGLGLATVYGIIKQNDGFINAYSEPGQGTTFRLYFRRHQGTGEPERVEEAVVHAASGSETILLVEDEESILDMTARMLELHGYRVLAASTPGEAIGIAEEHNGEIHLLMTDVIMPEMNGRELANKLLIRYPGLKGLFMSGYTADIIVHQGVLDEGVCFLQKPFSMNDLAARVREALNC